MRSFLQFAHAISGLLALLPSLSHAGGRFNIIRTFQEAQDTWVHYSTHVYKITDGNGDIINLDDTSQFSDGHLFGAALEAWREMYDAHGETEPEPRQRPKAMTALQVKGELFFSSSIKGNRDGFMAQFPNTPASIALDRCSVATVLDQRASDANRNGDTHKSNGNCGEPGAIDLFYRTYPEEPQDALPQPARIVTIIGGDDGPSGIIKPCASVDGDGLVEWSPWGCHRFLNDMNVRDVSKQTAAIDIPNDWTVFWATVCF